MSPVDIASRRLLAEHVVEQALTPGHPPASLLVGPAGIGKTSLLRMVGERLAQRRVQPLHVTGSSAGRAISLGAFIGLVAQLDSAPGLDPTVALIRHITALRNRGCLVFDNVDRLDPASLFVLVHFVRDARMPTVLTIRDSETLPEPVHELYDEGLIATLTVPPLDPAETVVLATSLLDGDLTPRAARTLTDRALGNPLYIRELVAGSRHNGTLKETPHGWDFVGLPRATPRLAQLVGAAFADLSEPDGDALGLLAVTDGVPVTLLPEDAVVRLTRRGLIEVDRDGKAGLTHPLFAEALVERCTASLLYRYRNEAIELLSGVVGQEPELAALHLAAGRQPPVALALGEARRALALMDHDRARQLARRVLQDSPDHPEACRLAGAAASAVGELGDADDLLSRSVRLATGDAARSVAARTRAHHVAVRRLAPLEAAEILTTVLEGLTDAAARSTVEHDLVQWQMVGGLASVLPAPPEAADDAAYTHHLMLTLMVALIAGPISEAEDKHRKLERLAPRFAEEVPTGQAITRMGRFMLLSYSGDIVAAREVAERRLRGSEDEPEMRGSWEYSLGMIELLDADLERAADLAGKAVEHLQWRDPLGLLSASLALAEAAYTALGSFSKAASYADQITETALADPKVSMLRAWASAWHEGAAGRRGNAAAILADAAEELLAVRHVFLAGMLAHCAARAGHAEVVLDQLERAAAAGGGVLDLFVEHARAIVDRDDSELARLVGDFDSFGMRASAIDGAALLAARARRAGRVMDARRWDWQARHALPPTTPVALWLHQPDPGVTLSPREREVALFAAQRLSSREIGDRLGVSEKTVNNQLGAVYRKLGVSGRSELRELVSDEPTG